MDTSDQEFLRLNGIAIEDLAAARCTVADLRAIDDHYAQDRSRLEGVRRSIQERLQDFDRVHSVRSRTKDPAHLLRKVVRKQLEDTQRTIRVENYQDEITDLVGVRVLHLFKSDWLAIHKKVTDEWNLTEKPKAKHRKGDAAELLNEYEKHGLEVEEHHAGYRSIHYLIQTTPAKTTVIVELQTRTLIEEAWSEIDHIIRYPDHSDDPLLAGYLVMFNRLAGNADEMGSYVLRLRAAMQESQHAYQEKLKEHQATIEKLKSELSLAKSRDRLDHLLGEMRPSFDIAGSLGLTLRQFEYGHGDPLPSVRANQGSFRNAYEGIAGFQDSARYGLRHYLHNVPTYASGLPTISHEDASATVSDGNVAEKEDVSPNEQDGEENGPARDGHGADSGKKP